MLGPTPFRFSLNDSGNPEESGKRGKFRTFCFAAESKEDLMIWKRTLNQLLITGFQVDDPQFNHLEVD